MMLWKYSLKKLRERPILHILNALQLTAVIVTAVIMVSSVMIRYRYYSAFKDIVQSNGLYCHFSMRANYDPNQNAAPDKYIADDKLKELIPEIENVISNNWAIETFLDDEGKIISFKPVLKTLYYDDEIITRYQPEMTEGRWLNPSDKASCVEGVVSESALNINVGDKIKMRVWALDQEDTLQEVLIVGKVKDNQKIVGYSLGKSSERLDITHFYGTVSSEVLQEAVLMMSSNYFSKNTSVLQGIFGPALITFSEDCPTEAIDLARQKLSAYNCSSSHLLSTVNKNSIDYVFEHLKNLSPIIAALLLMVVCSSISSSALTVRREMKSLAVFYITGLQWKHCSIISLIQALITWLFSLAASLIILAVIVFTDLGSDLYITFSWETCICVLAIAAFYILVSVLMPIFMLSRTTPKQILTR